MALRLSPLFWTAPNLKICMFIWAILYHERHEVIDVKYSSIIWRLLHIQTESYQEEMVILKHARNTYFDDRQYRYILNYRYNFSSFLVERQQTSTCLHIRQTNRICNDEQRRCSRFERAELTIIWKKDGDRHHWHQPIPLGCSSKRLLCYVEAVMWTREYVYTSWCEIPSYLM